MALLSSCPLPRPHFRAGQGARAWVDSLGAPAREPPGGIHLACSFACPCYLRPEALYEMVGCTFRRSRSPIPLKRRRVDGMNRIRRTAWIGTAGYLAPVHAPGSFSIGTILTPAASCAFGRSLCTPTAATGTGIPASVSPLKLAPHWHECQHQEATVGLCTLRGCTIEPTCTS